ncbi:chitin synthase-domain-containing protein [Lipomyces oligophaga]|uniref:chitin synthase-domain-containing protein n=1 Tax=Lipomyces oligophaga TaxID=45792 RepID=UPI0034CD81D0
METAHFGNYNVNTYTDLNDDDDVYDDDDIEPTTYNQPPVPQPQGYPAAPRYNPINQYESADEYDQEEDEEEETLEENPLAAVHQLATKKVGIQLYNNNLVLDCPVATNLSKASQFETPETSYMRYAAVTSTEPANYRHDGFDLRQNIYSDPRSTQLFIVITIYNEDDILLARTLKGVFKNIYNLRKSKDPKWGSESWQRVVVSIVADGRANVHPRVLGLMSSLGCYQEGVAFNTVGDKEVTAHVYEYTTNIGIGKVSDGVVELIDPSDKDTRDKSPKICPVQLLFCIKEKNAKKINSHRWFFEAFAPLLNPFVCILLDAGTKPDEHALYNLWLEFDRHDDVAGACGEIQADVGRWGKRLLNPLVATQNFEYKISNVLDKPLESAFGFISVLPGAFSAYRYTALLPSRYGNFFEDPESGEKTVLGPLDKYFKGEEVHKSNTGIFEQNMYLAEDRILCFALVAKPGCRWKLRYVSAATAVTDVPSELHDLIGQRRRWLNGSFFAALYALTHAFEIWHTNHSLIHKIMFHVEFIYQFFNLLFSWFSIANFFLVFYIISKSMGETFDAGKILSVILEWIYVACLMVCFIFSLGGNKPKTTNKAYVTIVVFFAILMIYLSVGVIYLSVKNIESITSIKFVDFFKNNILRSLVISLASTYIMYVVASLLFLQVGHLFTSFFQYMLLSPSYINVLNVYAFCNIHDLSWGTKGDNGPKQDLQKLSKGKDEDQSKKFAINVATDQSAIDEAYLRMHKLIENPLVEEVKKVDEKELAMSKFALIRSSFVMLWIVSNFALIAVVIQAGGVERLDGADDDDDDTATRISSIYLQVVLYSVAVLSFIRFVGAFWFVIGRIAFSAIHR